MFFTTFSILYFICIALGIQIVHDMLFYMLIVFTPRGLNRMIDVFKDYTKEVGGYAIFGDSIMMVSACALASIYANYSVNWNIINFMVTLYFLPYVLHSK